MFVSPLDVNAEHVAEALKRVVGVLEMALIQDHSRMQDLPLGDHAWPHGLQMPLLRLATPDDWRHFIDEGNQPE